MIYARSNPSQASGLSRVIIKSLSPGIPVHMQRQSISNVAFLAVALMSAVASRVWPKSKSFPRPATHPALADEITLDAGGANVPLEAQIALGLVRNFCDEVLSEPRR